jgi:predicted metal-binding membrane protein
VDPASTSAGPAAAPGGSLLQRALRRDRLLVVGGLLFVIVTSWAWLLMGAGMAEIDEALQPLPAAPWTLADALVVFVMWAVMMAAMMLPSATPMILLHATLARRANQRSAAGHAATGAFALGYLAVWIAFSVAATALQVALERAALLSPAMRTTSIALAGGVLIAAGIYQWTPLKHACLRHCRSPLAFVMAHWRPGTAGAWSMGLKHGSYCVGCCWLLMLLLFVGGVMNLGWIAGIALFVLLEKFVPAGHWVGRAAGLVLVGWGAAALLAAS